VKSPLRLGAQNERGCYTASNKGVLMKIKYQILKNQKGQSILEYIILTSLIGVFCLVGVQQFGGTMKNKINKINKKVERQIKIR
jgi:Flp pilus assembly pilin Flp